MFNSLEKKAADSGDIESYLREAGDELSKALVNIGIYPNVHGYYLLKDLTLMMLFNTTRQSMTAAYMALARKSGRTAASIERNVRSAITQAHNLGKLIKINSELGVNVAEKSYCLTNSQLINILAEFVHRKISVNATTGNS